LLQVFVLLDVARIGEESLVDLLEHIELEQIESVVGESDATLDHFQRQILIVLKREIDSWGVEVKLTYSFQRVWDVLEREESRSCDFEAVLKLGELEVVYDLAIRSVP
jgi:hypothetical protein